MRRNYRSLREFIALLEKEGELVRIAEPVSSVLEVTEITDRVCKEPGGGKALLFENVEGSEMPLLINAYGSQKRMNLSLGVDSLEEIADQITALINMKPPRTLVEKFSTVKTLFDVSRYIPKTCRQEAPCQEVIHTGDAVDLSRLPVLTCWPDDGGPFITFPLVITRSLEDGKRNMGMYRMQVYDKNTTGMHWHIHKDGATHFDEYRRAGKRMEVAVAIGSDPAVTYAATAPMPPGVDELLLAGLIRKKGVELVKCKTVDLEVPATAEIVLEGYVDPEERRVEGPFGDHTGYYSLKGEYPLFHVTAVTHRKNPIYFTTIVGKPPMEDCYIGKATERIFLPMLRLINPEVQDMSLPWEGVFHNCVIVSLHKRYPMQAKKLISGLWGAGQMSFSKMILAVDRGVDVHNYRDVARLVLNGLDLKRDLVVAEGVLDVLDHSSPNALFGKKLGIDGTGKMEGEGREGQEEVGVPTVNVTLEALQKVSPSIKGYSLPIEGVKTPIAFISFSKSRPNEVKELMAHLVEKKSLDTLQIVIFFDGDVDVENISFALWRVFNNVDSGRDLQFFGDLLSVDATKKLKGEGHDREWPDDIVMSQEIVEKVDEKWDSYFLNR